MILNMITILLRDRGSKQKKSADVSHPLGVKICNNALTKQHIGWKTDERFFGCPVFEKKSFNQWKNIVAMDFNPPPFQV